MKKIILLLLVVITFSCKSEKKEKETTPIVEEIEQKNAFTLSINAVVENDDSFILFYLEEGQTKINLKNSITANVLGSLDPQELNFKIKEEVLPTKLFLRFGNDQKFQKINFLTTYLSFGENSFSIENEKFFQFFNPNKFIDYDRENFIAISNEVDGEYKPRFGSRAVLIDKIFYEF